jgi:uncharacterized protein (DUF58 family)
MATSVRTPIPHAGRHLPLPHAALPQAELARAARLLVLRSRREATGLFAGNYRSAFRGGGLEFEFSRPWTPGDDVRSLDPRASARSGEPHVKIFREERDRELWLGLDVSGSMTFGSAGAAMAQTAAHALALIASAAGRAGDRIGLLAFAAGVREEVALARGRTQSARVIHAAVRAAAQSHGATDLRAAIHELRRRAGRRAVVVLLSDFRDPALAAGALRFELAGLARESDVVAAWLCDPREQTLVAAGGVRLRDAEGARGLRLLGTGSARARARYAAAARERSAQLASELRGAGAECVALANDRSPLFALARFFQERTGRRLGGAR